MSQVERDPEKLWKENRKYWESEAVEDHSINEKQHHFSFIQHFKFQLFISILIFISLLMMNNIEHPKITEFKHWMKQSLHESFDFVAIANWYEMTFDSSPSFIPQFGNKSELVLSSQLQPTSVKAMPVEDGVLIHTFAELLNGIQIAGKPGAAVYAVDKGRVILVPPKQDSVIIQHADQTISIYTNLHHVQVEVSQWVEVGTTLGVLAPSVDQDYSVLFLAMKKNDQYIDPLEVVEFE